MASRGLRSFTIGLPVMHYIKGSINAIVKFIQKSQFNSKLFHEKVYQLLGRSSNFYYYYFL